MKERILYVIIIYFGFLAFYFLLIFYYIIIPNDYNVSIIFFIGFSVLFGGIFLFFNLKHIPIIKEQYKLKVLSENTFKFIFIILMALTFCIPPVTFKTVIDWQQVSFLNNIRAVIFLIGCAFVPGSSLYKIFFNDNNFHERFQIESFLLKLTFYPLISFMFLGFTTLILDIIGLLRNQFPLLLFTIILVLFGIDLIIQKKRNNKFNFNNIKITISKHSLIIIIIALGVSLISIGCQMTVQYLIPGDSWSGISSSIYIGIPNTSPIDEHQTYSILWGYISFALSALGGIPYINVNVLLTIFNYISIISSYFLMRAILNDFKKSYSVLATIFLATFSQFYIFNQFTKPIGDYSKVSMLIFDLVINFRYKSYALLLFMSAMALFIILIKTNEQDNLFTKHFFKSTEFKFLILAIFMLLLSYMIYFFTMLFALLFVYIYCMLEKKIKKSFQFFFILSFLLLILFIVIDILMKFFLSWIPYTKLSDYLGIDHLYWVGIDVAFQYAIYLYLFFSIVLIISYLSFYIRIKYAHRQDSKESKSTIRQKLILYFNFSIIIIFSILLVIFLIQTDRNSKTLENNFIKYYVELIFIRIGLIGILGIYLSYYSYKKNMRLFFILTIWLSFIFFVSSFFLFKGFLLDYSFMQPLELPHDVLYEMNDWFNRTWYYSIPIFSILASIGILELENKLKNYSNFRNNNYNTIFKNVLICKIKNLNLVKKLRNYLNFSNKNSLIRKIKNLNLANKLKNCINFRNINCNIIFKNVLISLFIVSSVTNLLFVGIHFSGRKRGSVTDAEAQIMGWVSENLPKKSNILIDRFQFKKGLYYMANCNCFYVNDEYIDALEDFNFWTTKWDYADNCNIYYINNFDNRDKIIEIRDYSNISYAQLHTSFEKSQFYGTINFSVKTTDSSKLFFFVFQGDLGALINLAIYSNSFYYYNGKDDEQICELENDIWYNISIDFETTTGGYKALNQYKWNFFINGIKYGNLSLEENYSGIIALTLSTNKNISNYSIYFDNFYFSWDTNYSLDDYFPREILFNHLKTKKIKYIIFSPKKTWYNRLFPPILIESELLQYFNYKKLYEYKDIIVYYTPEI